MGIVREAADRPVVIGAGPAGLAAAWALKRVGVDPIVIERADGVCSSWRGHYRRLHLNSPRRISSLPGLRMERRLGRYVAREDFIEYVERYAERIDPDIRFGTEVERIERADGGWLVLTSAGALPARAVVVATGLNQRPQMPDWPGAASFRGELLHAGDYDEPGRFAGRDVLVVGFGASGTDIALELARAGDGRVLMSRRTSPIIYRRHVSTALLSQLVKHAPVPKVVVDRLSLLLHDLLWGDLSDCGLGRPREGMATSLAKRGHGATMDRGLVSAVRRGRIEVVPAVSGFDGDAVLLEDASRIEPEVVIAATGQRPGLEGLVGHLGVLGPPVGRPLVHGGRTAPGAPQLYFLGFRLPAGQLPDLFIDARVLARRIAASDTRQKRAQTLIERSEPVCQNPVGDGSRR
jgi:cation diffusion facilitator CzcD-associated flavoprotein CzcO